MNQSIINCTKGQTYFRYWSQIPIVGTCKLAKVYSVSWCKKSSLFVPAAAGDHVFSQGSEFIFLSNSEMVLGLSIHIVDFNLSRSLGNLWESICTCEVNISWTMDKASRFRHLATSIWKQCASSGMRNFWLCGRIALSLQAHPNNTPNLARDSLFRSSGLDVWT